MYTLTEEVTNMSQEQEDKQKKGALFLNTQSKYLINESKNDV